LQNISQTEPLDIRAVAKVVVDAANTNEVKAPPPPASAKPQAQKPQPAAATPAPPSAVDNQVKKQPAPRYMPRPAESKPEKQEPKKGFFTRVFGWAIRQKDPDDFLPVIDDKTMIDFEAYDETANIPVLFVLEGEARTEQIPITGDSFVLGRNKSEVDHCFETDRGISRVHAEVIYNGSNYFIIDRGSAGGTFVNGERVASGQSFPIKTGDIIGLYKKKLVFEIV
jgi:predicted component of type VI protein secretion system